MSLIKFESVWEDTLIKSIIYCEPIQYFKLILRYASRFMKTKEKSNIFILSSPNFIFHFSW